MHSPRAQIGVDLGGSKLLLVCGDRVERVATGPAFSPDACRAAVLAFAAASGQPTASLGIAIPGLVDASGRVTACDVLPAFSGWSPREALAALGCTIAVLNDVRAALLEELHDAPPGTTGGVVMAGTAIGAAFIVDGRPLGGTSGWAGELGYLPIVVEGSVKRLDEIAGGAAMATRRGVSGDELARAAARGDADSLRVIAEAGHALGLGLAAVVNLLNPSRLALGGGALALPGYWDAAARTAELHSLPDLWRDCRLTPVRAGSRVVALGALRAAAA